jgi:hypothetical protein
MEMGNKNLEELRCKWCSAPLQKSTLFCRYCGTEHQDNRGYTQQGFSGIGTYSGTFYAGIRYPQFMGAKEPKKPDLKSVGTIWL